jgi:hypothetical protein
LFISSQAGLQARVSNSITISIVSQRVQASLLLASPEEFGRFWKELIEKGDEWA